MATRAQAETGILSNRNLAWATAALLAVMLAAMARGAAEFPRLPALVQVHLLAMVVIMALTVPMLLQPKGTARHRLFGRCWAGLMFGNALLTLFFNAGSSASGGVFAGDFSPIHAISLFVLVMVPVAVLRARRHDVRGHEGSIRGLVIGSLLVAGFFTLPFGRVMGTWLLG
jgi:uncharacterized membrane protein